MACEGKAQAGPSQRGTIRHTFCRTSPNDCVLLFVYELGAVNVRSDLARLIVCSDLYAMSDSFGRGFSR